MRLPAALLSTALIACSTPADPGPTPGPSDGLVLVRVATLDRPIAIASRAADPAGIYVTERAGRVVRVEDGQTEQVLSLVGGVSTEEEQGLVGLAFSPDDRLFVSYTDLDGALVIASYAIEGPRATPASRDELLTIEQPTPRHNGGDIHFGPDGFLYVGAGDGGRARFGQRRDTLLGKMLRIDVSVSPYAVPTDNPFVGRAGTRDEILHTGLRNPWRFTIDPVEDVAWIADVGELAFEEINRVPLSRLGANFGWSRMEGFEPFRGTPLQRHHAPVHVYEHSPTRCAVMGGVVLRDPRLPALHGRYLFTDYCDGVLRYLEASGDGYIDRSLGIGLANPVSFGATSRGEVLVSSLDGGVYRLDPVDG